MQVFVLIDTENCIVGIYDCAEKAHKEIRRRHPSAVIATASENFNGRNGSKYIDVYYSKYLIPHEMLQIPYNVYNIKELTVQ